MNDLTLREEWIAGQKCEIYSISKDQWFTGKIHDVFIDDEGEWLEIRYNKSCSKQVQRYSVNVRPHPKYYDNDKSQLLVNGYIRMVQLQYLFKTIPHELHKRIFTFFFVGDAPFLSDDADVSDSDDNINDDSDNNNHLRIINNNDDIGIINDCGGYNDENDNESLSPSPESKNLALEYLKRKIEERNNRRIAHILRQRRNTRKFTYPATGSVRYGNNKLWDISETHQVPKIQFHQQNDDDNDDDYLFQHNNDNDDDDDDDDHNNHNDDDYAYALKQRQEKSS